MSSSLSENLVQDPCELCQSPCGDILRLRKKIELLKLREIVREALELHFSGKINRLKFLEIFRNFEITKADFEQNFNERFD